MRVIVLEAAASGVELSGVEGRAQQGGVQPSWNPEGGLSCGWADSQVRTRTSNLPGEWNLCLDILFSPSFADVCDLTPIDFLLLF